MSQYDFNANALMGIGQGVVQPQTNQLQNIATAQSIKNTALSYEQNALALAGARARGKAYADNYNPLSGKYDLMGIQKEMSSTDQGSYALPETVTQLRSQQKQAIENDQAQTQLQATRAGHIAGLAAPLMNNPDVTKADVARQLGVGVATGTIDLGTAQKVYSSLPADSKGIRTSVRGLMDSLMPGAGQSADAFGSLQLVDVGGHLQWQNVGSPASGQGGVNQGAPISKTLTPGEATAPQPYNDADGKPKIGTRAQVAQANGQGGYVDTTNKPTVPLDVMGSGRYQGSQNDFSGAGANAQPGGFSAGPPAGQLEAQRATAEAGAKGANALLSADAGRNDRLAMLGNMDTDLDGFTSGPGHDRMRKIQATFNNIVPGAEWGERGIESAQSFNKWAQQLANAQSQALGSSDARQAAAEHANPNSGLQKETNQLMIHQLMGKEDAIHAKANAWRASGLPAAQYQAWDQQFSQNFDPRAFQILRMTPAERQKVFQGMKNTGQLDEFKQTYNRMAAAGLVPSGR